MARSVMCIPCNFKFISEEAFQVHKQSKHTIFVNGTPIEDPTPPQEPVIPDGIPPEALPSPEFIQQVQEMEKAKQADQDSKPSQHPNELPPAKELKLTYLWVGECPTCRIPPTSIELDVRDIHFVVAICDRCKAQLDSKEVAKL